MLTGGTDEHRWRDPEDPAYHTAERNRLIARLIPAGASVLDLGAGQQELRRHLPRGCEYQACDLFEGPGVLQCDFNAGVYPAVEHRYDVLVASGLLEFLTHPEDFLARLPEFGDDDLALDAIREVPSGGHHFGTAHTLARYETAFYRPLLADWSNFEAFEEAGSRDATRRASDIWRRLRDEFVPPPLDPAVREEIDAFVARRTAEIGG